MDVAADATAAKEPPRSAMAAGIGQVSGARSVSHPAVVPCGRPPLGSGRQRHGCPGRHKSSATFASRRL